MASASYRVSAFPLRMVDFVTIADRSTKLSAALRLTANAKSGGLGLGEWR